MALYAYFGYGVLLWLIRKIKGGPVPADIPDHHAALPFISFVIPAYNESNILEEKIRNTNFLDYPPELLEIILITDGSSDDSKHAGHLFPGIMHLHEDERRGKSAAINRAVPFCRGDIVVITDANTLLNKEALLMLAPHYRSENTGGVSGEKRVMSEQGTGSAGSEGLYWKYESFLKRGSAGLYTIVGAAGEFFSFRRVLFTPIPEDSILDDFILSMNIVKQGYRIGYEPEAYAMEKPSRNISDEFQRKRRISAGVFQSLVRNPYLFNPFSRPVVWFQFISHRFLRWTLAPLGLLLCAVIACILWDDSLFYGVFALLSLLFAVLAVVGYLLRDRSVNIPGFFVPFYFTMMNLALGVGFIDYLRGKQSVLWKKAAR